MTQTLLPSLTRRCDKQTAAEVDEGVRLAATDGIGQAVTYMRGRNIPPTTMLRVLTAPEFHRPLVHEAR